MLGHKLNGTPVCRTEAWNRSLALAAGLGLMMGSVAAGTWTIAAHEDAVWGALETAVAKVATIANSIAEDLSSDAEMGRYSCVNTQTQYPYVIVDPEECA